MHQLATPPLRRGRPRAGAVVGLLLVVLLGAAGCRVDTLVTIDVAEDGSGSVEVRTTLDRDALDQVGGDLEAVLEVGDLEQAGWTVEGPRRAGGGGVEVAVSKPFGTPAEGAAVITEITGPGGPLRRFRIERSTPFAETVWAVRGVVDLSGGIEAFGDEGLAAELDGLPIGRPVDALEAELGEPLRKTFDLRVRVALPADAEDQTWRARFGDDPLRIEVSESERRMDVLLWLGVAAALVLLLVVLLLVRLILRRRRRAHGAHGAHAAH